MVSQIFTIALLLASTFISVTSANKKLKKLKLLQKKQLKKGYKKHIEPAHYEGHSGGHEAAYGGGHLPHGWEHGGW